MADGLSKSLDDLIKESRKSNGNGKGSRTNKGGAVKANRDSGVSKPKASVVSRNNRDNRIQQQQHIKKPFQSRSDDKSILSRLGDNKGVEVCFSNLNPDIPASDIQELCETIGTVLRTNKARNGKIFAGFEKAGDARKCVEKFNNRTFDGTPMVVELVEKATSAASSDNVKSGMFGTKLAAGGNNNTTFRVTLSAPSSAPVRAPVRAPSSAPSSAPKGKKVKTFAAKKEPASAEALDDELDNYMSAKSNK